jgi:hypothetical protein
MRRLFTSVVAVAVVLAFSGMALAQAKQAPVEKKPAAQAASTQAEKSATPAKAKAGKASGTIKAASETKLTLTTKEGDKEFTLDPKTVVAEGTKTLKAADLAGLVGQSAVVHYTETGTVVTVHKVTVSKPKAAEKKEAPKK